MAFRIFLLFTALSVTQPCLAQYAVLTGRQDAGFFSMMDDVIAALKFVEQGYGREWR